MFEQMLKIVQNVMVRASFYLFRCNEIIIIYN